MNPGLVFQNTFWFGLDLSLKFRNFTSFTFWKQFGFTFVYGVTGFRSFFLLSPVLVQIWVPKMVEVRICCCCFGFVCVYVVQVRIFTFWKVVDEYSWWFCVGVINVLHFFAFDPKRKRKFGRLGFLKEKLLLLLLFLKCCCCSWVFLVLLCVWFCEKEKKLWVRV